MNQYAGEVNNSFMSRLNEDLHPALTQPILSKLFKKSIYTALSFVRTNPELLSKTTGLPYSLVLEVKESILTKFSSKLRNGQKHYQEILNCCAILPTGIENFNKLLDGGFMTGYTYELCGFAGCGKTQICMTVAVNVCLSTQQEVLYIDTKNDISAHRLCGIIERHKVANVGETLQKIQICHVLNAYNLLNELNLLEKRIKNKELGCRLVIVDSLCALFQQFDNHHKGLSVLNNVANLLNFLTSEYHLCVILTNFVTSWASDINPGELENEGESEIQKVQQPALGKYWAHVPNIRIMVKKVDGGNECFLTILKSSNQPFGKAVKVKLGDDGVT